MGLGDKPRDEVRIVPDRIIAGDPYRRCPACDKLKPMAEFEQEDTDLLHPQCAACR